MQEPYGWLLLTSRSILVMEFNDDYETRKNDSAGLPPDSFLLRAIDLGTGFRDKPFHRHLERKRS
jgi:hypothetical protein